MKYKIGDQVWHKCISWTYTREIRWYPAVVVSRNKDEYVISGYKERVHYSDLRPRDKRKQGLDRPDIKERNERNSRR